MPQPSTATRAPVCVERAAVCFAVDAAGESGDDGDAGGGEVAGERARDLSAVAGTRTCADDRDGGCAERLLNMVAAGVQMLSRWVEELVEAAVPDAPVPGGGRSHRFCLLQREGGRPGP